MIDSNENLANDKLLILYILQKVNKPINYKELLELVISISEMNYFNFRQILLELVNDKFILKYEQNNEEIIELTKEGQNALDLTINMLPGILKLNVDSKFKQNFNEIKDKYSVLAEYVPINENSFSVKCKIIENNITIFNLETYAGSRENAKAIVENWNTNASQIYPKILDILIRKLKILNKKIDLVYMSIKFVLFLHTQYQ